MAILTADTCIYPESALPDGDHSIAPCTCGSLRRAARALTQRYDVAMAGSGMRVTQYSLLRTLARNGPTGVTALATQQLLERTALSRNLAPLVAQGWVDVTAGRDARTRVASLTAAGHAALAAAEPLWTRAQEDVTRSLGARKLDTLLALLGDVESLHPAHAAR